MNKILLGLIGILVVGELAIFSALHTLAQQNGTSLLGAIGGYPVHLPQSATRFDSDVFISNNAEVGGTLWADGALNVSGTTQFAGAVTGLATSTLTGLSVSGASSLNTLITSGNVAIGTSTLTYDLTVGNGIATTTVVYGTPESAIATRVCQWNGVTYSIRVFAANSATSTVTTSTLCQ